MKLKFTVLAIAVGFSVLFTDSLLAQRGQGGRRRVGGPGMGELFQFMGNMRMLSQKSISDELDLNQEQTQKLKELNDDIRSEMRDLMGSMRDKSEDERSSELESFTKDLNEAVDKILLPHQRKRFKQISLQSSMRGGRGRTGGVTALLQNKALMKELGYSESQVKEMLEKARKKTEEVNKDVNAKVTKIQTEAQKEIMSVLPKKLQKAIEEQLGESFDFNTMQRARPQRGQRGGGNERGRDGGGQ